MNSHQFQPRISHPISLSMCIHVFLKNNNKKSWLLFFSMYFLICLNLLNVISVLIMLFTSSNCQTLTAIWRVPLISLLGLMVIPGHSCFPYNCFHVCFPLLSLKPMKADIKLVPCQPNSLIPSVVPICSWSSLFVWRMTRGVYVQLVNPVAAWKHCP